MRRVTTCARSVLGRQGTAVSASPKSVSEGGHEWVGCSETRGGAFGITDIFVGAAADPGIPLGLVGLSPESLRFTAFVQVISAPRFFRR